MAEELVKKLNEIRKPVTKLESLISKLNLKLETEKYKIEDEVAKLQDQITQYSYLDYLNTTSNNNIIFLKDEGEILNRNSDISDEEFWEKHIPTLTNFRLESCILRLVYKTPYYANRDSYREFDEEPDRSDVYDRLGKEIDVDWSNIPFDIILDYHRDDENLIEGDGDSDGLYEILTLELSCYLFIRK